MIDLLLNCMLAYNYYPAPTPFAKGPVPPKPNRPSVKVVPVVNDMFATLFMLF